MVRLFSLFLPYVTSLTSLKITPYKQQFRLGFDLKDLAHDLGYCCIAKKQEETEFAGPPQKKIKPSPSKEELKTTIIDLRKKVKVLQQKVRRQNSKITTQSELIADLKQRNLLDDDIAVMVDDNFSGIIADVIKNQLKNQIRDPRGRRYTDEVKNCFDSRFLLTTRL